MATTATVFSLESNAFPFIGIGVPAAQLITPIPSAELTFTIIDGAITVAAGAADQKLTINCRLPRSFCYVLVECSMSISSVNADDWDEGSSSVLQDSDSAPVTNIPLNICSKCVGNTTTTNEIRTYTLREPPAKLMVPGSLTDARLQISVFNSTVDGAAGLVHFHARFLRYDRNQSQFWQVNTPVLTR